MGETTPRGIADGTSVIPAVAQGIPVRYVATIYAKFPNVVYAKESSGISKAADLKGRKLGTPGKYGSSWIMLQALLRSASLTPSDVDIQAYPDYGQGTALAQGAVVMTTEKGKAMKVVGHGIDRIELARVGASLRSSPGDFRQATFTDAEGELAREQAERAGYYGGRLGAKERRAMRARQGR